MERVICVLIGYVCGLFQTGYIYGKLHHIDIRQHGSGNAGATNTLRTLGVKAGIVVLLGDAFKCILAVLIAHLLFGKTDTDIMPLLAMYAGAGAVIGHNYPFYLKFKGGKGIAATAGLILATNFWFAVIELILFAVIVGTTRYVSVGSLAVVTGFLIEVIVYGQRGGFHMAQPYLYEMYAVAAFLMLSGFYRHRANIRRLLAGNENKFSLKK